MKRINYDGQTLVTGTAVAEQIATYAENVARMGTSATVAIPALEDNGTVIRHTLLLNASTALETFDIDGDLDDEDERFPLADLTPVGGKVHAVGEGEDVRTPMTD